MAKKQPEKTNKNTKKKEAEKKKTTAGMIWEIVQTLLMAAVLYLSPVLAILIAWLWLGELPGLPALAGGAVVVAGVILVQKAFSKAI